MSPLSQRLLPQMTASLYLGRPGRAVKYFHNFWVDGTQKMWGRQKRRWDPKKGTRTSPEAVFTGANLGTAPCLHWTEISQFY